MQAETRVNAEQAPKRCIAEADPSELWGRPMPRGEIATAPRGSAGVMASVCMEEEIDETREALAAVARDHQPDSGDGLAWAA
jgi:hypothetical protein